MKKMVISIVILCFGLGVDAHVSLFYPSGERSYIHDEEINIQWEVTVIHNTLNWDLYFSSDGGNSWEIIQLDIPASTLTYKWKVPDISTVNARIKIVQDNSELDYEDLSNNLTILGTSLFSTTQKYPSNNLYPNPFSYSATINFRNPSKSSFSFLIFNEKGQIVKTYYGIDSEQFILNRENLVAGCYYFQLQSDTQQKGETGKFIIR